MCLVSLSFRPNFPTGKLTKVQIFDTKKYFRPVTLPNKPQRSHVLFDLTEGESRGMAEIRIGDFFNRSNFGHLVVMLKNYVYFAYYKAMVNSVYIVVTGCESDRFVFSDARIPRGTCVTFLIRHLLRLSPVVTAQSSIKKHHGLFDERGCRYWFRLIFCRSS